MKTPLPPPAPVPSSPSPSTLDGIPASVTSLALAHAVDIIFLSSRLLRLPITTAAAAATLLHRFYSVTSLASHGTIWAAAATLLISTKASSHNRRVRDLANAVHYAFAIHESRAAKTLDYFSHAGFEWKRAIVDAERHILRDLGFHTAVDAPHRYVLVVHASLRERAAAAAGDSVGAWKALLAAAWRLCNDAHRTTVVVEFPARTMACACIALAAEGAVALPERWAEVFGAGGVGVVVERLRAMDRGATRGRFVDVARCGFEDML